MLNERPLRATKSKWFLAVGASLVVILAGCGGGAEPAGRDPNQALTVVGQFEVHSVDPATAAGFFTRLQVAETLVGTDLKGALEPGLATEWKVSSDRREWRFTLPTGVVFHDGTALTAETVASALTIARGKEGPLASVDVQKITADGPSTVVVQLRTPFAPLPAVLADTSAQILAPASYRDDGTVTEVIGSGPYRVQQLKIPQGIDLAAFDRWRGEKPALGRVSYLAVGRSESRALMADSGQADVTFGLDPVSINRLRTNDDLRIDAITQPRSIQLKVNADHPILGDVRVRRALSLALDRPAMATALLRDPEMAATQLFPPSLPDWHQPSLTPLTHDLAAARALLAEAGWTPGADAVLTKNGRPFELTLLTFPDRPELPVLATAIQAKLKELGVTVDVQVGNSSAIPAGHQDGTLELALYARNYSLVPDPLVTMLEDFSPKGADWGAMGWTNPALTRTLTDMADGIDAAGGTAGRRQVAEIMQAELPVIPVAWYRMSTAVNTQIDGLVIDPLERSWRLADLSWAS
jgi:peptide/nickel transport system substrate-binding protein